MISSVSVASPWLYCNVQEDEYIYHFDVSLHDVEDFTNGGTSDTTFNYLSIENFVKEGPNPNLPGHIEYRIMDVSFLDPAKNYRITIIYANSKHDLRPASSREYYGHAGPSEPFFTNQPNLGITGIIIKEVE